VRLFVRSSVPVSVCLLVRSFVRLFGNFFIRLILRSFVRLCVCLFVRLFILWIAPLFVCSFVRLFVRSLVCKFVRSLKLSNRHCCRGLPLDDVGRKVQLEAESVFSQLTPGPPKLRKKRQRMIYRKEMPKCRPKKHQIF
jgi:hypothetical protein